MPKFESAPRISHGPWHGSIVNPPWNLTAVAREYGRNGDLGHRLTRAIDNSTPQRLVPFHEMHVGNLDFSAPLFDRVLPPTKIWIHQIITIHDFQVIAVAWLQSAESIAPLRVCPGFALGKPARLVDLYALTDNRAGLPEPTDSNHYISSWAALIKDPA